MEASDRAERRRLTDRQTAVLAAVERLGRPSMPELHREFPRLAPSAINRVLAALESKGLVACAGDPHQVYLGGVQWWSTASGSGFEDPRFARLTAAVEKAELGCEVTADPASGTVTVFLPVAEVESYLAGRASVGAERIRGLVWRLERDREPVRLAIRSEISVGPQPRLSVELTPA